jgi:hypothetical protein
MFLGINWKKNNNKKQQQKHTHTKKTTALTFSCKTIA